MLLKKHRYPGKEIWTRQYIKYDMCDVCILKSNNCSKNGVPINCIRMNDNGELFDGKYKYAYVVKKM